MQRNVATARTRPRPVEVAVRPPRDDASAPERQLYLAVDPFQARRLDHAVRANAAAIAGLLALVPDSSVGVEAGDDGGVGSLLQHLARGVHYGPEVMLDLQQYAQALLSGRSDGHCRRLRQRLATATPCDGPPALRFRDEAEILFEFLTVGTIGVRVPRGDAVLDIPSAREKSHCELRYTGARTLLGDGAPAHLAEFDALVRQVKPVRRLAGPEAGIIAAARAGRWGELILELDDGSSRLDVALAMTQGVACQLLLVAAGRAWSAEQDVGAAFGQSAAHVSMEPSVIRLCLGVRVRDLLRTLLIAGVLEADEVRQARDCLSRCEKQLQRDTEALGMVHELDPVNARIKELLRPLLAERCQA